MIYAFLNQKGGVGKSTLSAHCAAWHYARGKRVYVIDADAQESVAQWLRKSVADPDNVALDIPFSSISDADDVITDAREQSSCNDLVIIDGAGGAKELCRGACLVADVVILPVGPSAMEM